MTIFLTKTRLAKSMTFWILNAILFIGAVVALIIVARPQIRQPRLLCNLQQRRHSSLNMLTSRKIGPSSLTLIASFPVRVLIPLLPRSTSNDLKPWSCPWPPEPPCVLVYAKIPLRPIVMWADPRPAARPLIPRPPIHCQKKFRWPPTPSGPPGRTRVSSPPPIEFVFRRLPLKKIARSTWRTGAPPTRPRPLRGQARGPRPKVLFQCKDKIAIPIIIT